MRKLIYTLLSLLILSGSAIGQNISLADNHGVIGPNDTVFYFGDINSLIVSHVFVTNNSAADMSIRCVREEIFTVSGSSNYFCWDQCFAPNIDTSGLRILTSGTTDKNSFSGDYEAFGSIGKSYVRYKFYDESNPVDYATVLVEYNATAVGFEENASNKDIKLNVFPNPASSYANIEFDINGSESVQVFISDIIGNIVYLSDKEIRPSGINTLNIDLASMNQGIYFVKVIVGDQVFTRKLNIR